MEEDKNELIEVSTNDLYKQGDDLVNELIKENDTSKVNDLTNLFKLNQKKKDIYRANKLSNLLNLIDNEVYDRISATPESFDNYDLLKYMESTQSAISNTYQNLDRQPLIQINNQKNEINFNNSGLDRESRARVLEVVSAIISNANNVIDVEEDENG